MNNEHQNVETEIVENEEIQQEQEEQVSVLKVKTRIRAGFASDACRGDCGFI